MPELMVSLALFSILIIVLVAALSNATRVWHRTSGVSTIQTQMIKLQASLVRELEAADFQQLRTGNGPTSLGAAPDGSALWFLSNIDPASGRAQRKVDGSPFWQRNILYYAVAPDNHLATFGVNCSGGAGPTGFEAQCPHKVIVRKVIDFGTATVTTDETTEEQLMAAGDVAAYLTRPAGFDVTAMNAEPGVETVAVKANSLLYVDMRQAPDPTNYPGEVVLDFRALNLPAARKEIAVGQTPLADSRFTVRQLLSVFPQN